MPENHHLPNSYPSELPLYTGYDLETPEVEASFGERVSAHLESRSFKRRLNRIGATVAAGMLVTTGIVVHNSMEDTRRGSDMATADYAPENPNLQYGVVNAPDGVYSRNSPHTEDTPKVAGQGVYNGDTVQLICGITNGDAVGKNDNNTWHKVKNLSRPTQPDFWLNDYHIASPNVADQLAPGEPQCEANTVPQRPPAESNPNPPGLQNRAPQPAPPQNFVEGASVFYSPGDGVTEQGYAIHSPADITMSNIGGKGLDWSANEFGGRCNTQQADDFPEYVEGTNERVTTLAGWSIGRLGLSYFLKETASQYATPESKRKRDNINYLVLYDPASLDEYVDDRDGCTDLNQSEELAKWLKESPENRMVIFAGDITKDESHINGTYAHQGLQEVLFAPAIRGDVNIVDQVVVCNYNLKHFETYEKLKDYMNRPKIMQPEECPKINGFQEGWRP